MNVWSPHRDPSLIPPLSEPPPKPLIGQAHQIRRLTKIVLGAKKRGEAIVNQLLVGAAGTGKSTLARWLAHLYGTMLHVVRGDRAMTLLKFAEGVKSVSDTEILFIDEVHALGKDIQEALFALVDRGELPAIKEFKDGRRPRLNGVRKVSRVSILLATDQPGLLVPALLNRFRVIVMAPYDREDLVAIGKDYMTELKITVSTQALNLLVSQCEWIPRSLKLNLQALAQLHSESAESLGIEHVRELFDGEGPDHAGLMRWERRYLELFKTSWHELSISVIAKKLSFDQRYVITKIEPRLVEEGYITIKGNARLRGPLGSSVLDLKHPDYKEPESIPDGNKPIC